MYIVDYRLYSSLNKWVFSDRLKYCTLVVSIHLRLSGSPFHSLGAADAKARSPRVVHRVRGWTSVTESSDLRERLGTYRVIMSLRYTGELPPSALNTWTSILYSTRRLMGSQCRPMRTGVMWSTYSTLSAVTLLCT